MRKEEVEIYSDASNFAIMRHPGRRFPGSLIQGDTLSSLCSHAYFACKYLEEGKKEQALESMTEIRDALIARLTHYEDVLEAHGMEKLKGAVFPR